MKILKLSASNVKRLVAVEIKPDGSLVIIGGKNEQGKSACLDSIQYAIGGAKNIPGEPIRKGERRAKIVVDLEGGLRATRVFDKSGSRLSLTDESGAKLGSPQAVLDKLYNSEVVLDPGEYSRMDSKKQARILRELLGIDTAELDSRRKALFDERTECNREIKQLRARLKAAAKHDDAPTEEVNVAELTEELERRRETTDDHERQRAQAKQLKQEADGYENTTAQTEGDIIAIEKKLEALRNDLVATQAAHRKALAIAKRAKKAAAKLTDPDLDEVREQLRGAQETNRKVRENAEHASLVSEGRDAAEEIEALTDEIADIDDAKRELLEQAEFPIDGLGFDEDGVTLKGVPLEQASQAERLRVSVAIGIAMNPELRVLLIRDGSLLDEDSLAMVARMAEEADAQVWLEVVSTDDEKCTVVIEDGSVRGASGDSE